MRIEQDMKLDYKDVLIRPKRSTLKSRSQVRLDRKFKFRNSKADYEGVPIMASNMDGVGTFEMADTLAEQNIFSCLVKTYTVEQLIIYFDNNDVPERTNNVAMSIGTSDDDFQKLVAVQTHVGDKLKYVCMDIANGYSDHFAARVRKVREQFPNIVIIAGNVVTSDQTQELILNGKPQLSSMPNSKPCLMMMMVGVKSVFIIFAAKMSKSSTMVVYLELAVV